MASEHGMIEPFEPGQVRHAADGQRIVSYGTSSYGYDIRCAPEFKVFTNIYSTVVDPKNFDERSFVDIKADVCIIPPNSFALARTRGVLPHSAQRADDLPGQEHLRALRHHRQRDAVRARMGRLRDARVQQHHAAAGQDLRRRGLRAGAVLRERRGLRDQLQGPRRQVPGPARRHACPRPERPHAAGTPAARLRGPSRARTVAAGSRGRPP